MIPSFKEIVFILAATVLGAAAAADYPCTGKYVQGGNDCWQLAKDCKLSEDTFKKYNPSCPNIQVGQLVCCTKPSYTANPDGSCHMHTQSGTEYCSDIAKKYGITNDDIEKWNADTFGWKTCQFLGKGMKICVSPGTPPRPTSDPSAECGPLAPGDKYNSECPLKACCSEFGYCGLTSQFCDKKNSTTGAPGTTGCFSNCDIEFVKSDPPSEFIHVGYYESWNQGWPCMRSSVDELNLDKFTHVHFSFADIDSSLQPTLDKYASAQWSRFKKISKRKIVSFGGWGISTEPATYQNLRNMVQPANRATAAKNLVAFMTKNGLDGIDIDWEYPGAPDIPGIPPGLPGDGGNYLEFLKEVRKIMPEGKSLSIAAPASYWYLKSFPIDKISKVVDYIVFMTYDLHGQWDHDNQFTGPYLLSHVNWTETSDMLNLITHSGVPGNKVILGLAGYGRSFQQSDPSCYGPSCTFTGTRNVSHATPGPCTNTSGYLSLAEINRIRGTTRVRNEYTDAGSQIMLYDNDQWIAFNTPDQLDKREQLARNMNLGGTVLWAIDLDGSNGELAADPCDVKSLSNDEFIASDCPDKEAALLAWIEEVIRDMQSLDSSILTRLELDPSKRIKQLQDIKETISSAKSTRKREVPMDISAGAHALTANAANYADLVKINQYSISIDPMKEAQAIESLVLADLAKLNIRRNQVLVAIAVATLSAPAIGGIYLAGSSFVYISYSALHDWTYDCTWFWNKHRTLEDELDNCVSKDDLLKNLIIDDMDTSVEDSSGTPGPTQSTSTINIPIIGQNTCPSMNTLTKTQVDTVITGDFRTITKSWEKDKNGNKKCILPVYYINMEGHSLGVACNGYKYMAARGNIVYSRGLLTSSADRKPNRLQLRMHMGCPQLHSVLNDAGQTGSPYYNKSPANRRDQQDEFPMNAMYEGYRKSTVQGGTDIHIYDTSILCIPWYENMVDGLVYWNKFLNASPPYDKCDPMDPDSPDRDGPIPFAQSATQRSYFIVQALIGGNFNDVCVNNHQSYRVPGFKTSSYMDSSVSPYRYKTTWKYKTAFVSNEFQQYF
ncbi:hypothetical protein LPJ59_001405 [Coemansia sp. RSA 2399]|nr:hypothetical protein LPJ59_001405 [Coemansia sp. RSA 2399]KAJ1906614.1 hypothetical protein LPJ81_001255 [Coemansia sp. IMI 209127]